MASKRSFTDAFEPESTITNEDEYYGKIIRVEDSSETLEPAYCKDLDSTDEETTNSVEIVESHINRRGHFNLHRNLDSNSIDSETSSTHQESDFDHPPSEVDESFENTSESEEEYNSGESSFSDSEWSCSSEEFDSEDCTDESGFTYVSDSLVDSHECLSECDCDYCLDTFNDPSISSDSDVEILETVRGRNNSQVRRINDNFEDSDVIVLDNIMNNPVFNDIALLLSFYSSLNLQWYEDQNSQIRYDLISEDFIRSVKDKIKCIAGTSNTNLLFAAIRDLLRLCSAYSRDEILHIQNRVRTCLVNERYQDPSVSEILNLIYDWRRLDNPRGARIKKMKKYKSVMHKNLINSTEKSCSICYEEFKPTVKCSTMDCHHVFHTVCLNKWLKESDCCPFCRVRPSD